MIKNEKRLIIIAVGIPVLAILIITLLYSFSQISPIIFTSILIGIIISTVIFLLGVLSINFSINKSDKLFLMLLWGSFLFKLILGLEAVLITLIFLEINTYGFIFSILFFYIFYLIIEIIYLDLRRKSRFDGK
jgi:hypothetical protein